jgi:hypothetical protein
MSYRLLNHCQAARQCKKLAVLTQACPKKKNHCEEILADKGAVVALRHDCASCIENSVISAPPHLRHHRHCLIRQQ